MDRIDSELGESVVGLVTLAGQQNICILIFPQEGQWDTACIPENEVHSYIVTGNQTYMDIHSPFLSAHKSKLAV